MEFNISLAPKRPSCTRARGVETSNAKAENATNKASPLLPSVHVPGGKCHSDAKPMNSDRGRVPPIIPLKLDSNV